MDIKVNKNGSLKPVEVTIIKKEDDIDKIKLSDDENEDHKVDKECWVCFLSSNCYC